MWVGVIGGDVSIVSGSSSSNNGGSILLHSGVSSTNVGGNIYLQPGSGVSADGSVTFKKASGLSNFGVISESVLDFSISSSVIIESLGTVEISSLSSMTLSASNGINIGDSFIHGFEIGGGSTVNNEITLNKQAGYFTIPGTPTGFDSVFVTVYNSHAQSGNIVLSSIMVSPGTQCSPLIRRSQADIGVIHFEIYNYFFPSCTGNIGIQFLLIG